MKGIVLTKQAVEAHQRKHGFILGGPQVVVEDKPVPKPRMNATETEFSLMLEAQKRRGEILEWRFEGISLAWGCDPVTGKPMRYKADFVVIEAKQEDDDSTIPWAVRLKIVEVKGNFIHPQDLIRFKGCRSDWPMFRFELHQKANGEWRQVL